MKKGICLSNLEFCSYEGKGDNEMEVININDKLHDIIMKYSDVKEIMVELGFSDILKPGMLQSVGRIMTIDKGAKAKKINRDLIISTFKEHGYKLI